MEIKPAKIVDNKVYCPNCNSDDISFIREHKVVNVDGKFYSRMIKQCYKCGQNMYYLLTEIKLDEDVKRFVVDEIKMLELKEDE